MYFVSMRDFLHTTRVLGLTFATSRVDLIVLTSRVCKRGPCITNTSRFHILSLIAGARLGRSGGDGRIKKGLPSLIPSSSGTFIGTSIAREGSSTHWGSSTSSILLELPGCVVTRGRSSSLGLLAGTSEFLTLLLDDPGNNGSNYDKDYQLI